MGFIDVLLKHYLPVLAILSTSNVRSFKGIILSSFERLLASGTSVELPSDLGADDFPSNN